jgi:hypothetical protein
VSSPTAALHLPHPFLLNPDISSFPHPFPWLHGSAGCTPEPRRQISPSARAAAGPSLPARGLRIPRGKKKRKDDDFLCLLLPVPLPRPGSSAQVEECSALSKRRPARSQRCHLHLQGKPTATTCVLRKTYLCLHPPAQGYVPACSFQLEQYSPVWNMQPQPKVAEEIGVVAFRG